MSRFFKEHLIEALDIQEENNKNKTPRHEKKIKTMIKHRNGKTVITAIALSTISKETCTPMSTLHNYCEENNIEVIQS
ncbi:MAG: hypothetical protein LUG89_06015 [Methanosphaera sp.]|nr:hypothetical protein [Methanosphaera sp.]